MLTLDMRIAVSLFLLVLCTLPTAGLVQAQSAESLSAAQIDQKAKAATVIVLAGEGAGRLDRISTGVIISKDGTLLTALHAVKGAAEVQVRLADGDVFDHVELTGTDERRDIAALKISAGGLPFLAAAPSTFSQGDPVYAVTNANGLTWSATEGVLSAIRPADEIPGAGTGFRLLQFTAPVAPGSSGGALLNGKGQLIGIITGKMGSSGDGFAVPAESVIQLPGTSAPVSFGSGESLKMPVTPAVQVESESTAIASANPRQLLINAKTVYIHSKTSFLTVDTLDRALLLQKQWKALGMEIVQDPRVADILIEIDRPLFTYVHTFVITDKRTSIVLGSGKVTAFDGTTASGPLASKIIAIFSAARLPAEKAKD